MIYCNKCDDMVQCYIYEEYGCVKWICRNCANIVDIEYYDHDDEDGV